VPVDVFGEWCYTRGMEKEVHLKLTVRLYTDDNERCFGPGIATLLHRVQEHHSLRAAAGSMGMAYSKAWRIVRTAEDIFGCKLLDSTIGGRNGGGALLTPRAEDLLNVYDAYCEDVNVYSREKFQQAFACFQPEKQVK